MAYTWKLNLCFAICCLSTSFSICTAVVTKISLNSNNIGKKMEGHGIKLMAVNGLAVCLHECMITSNCLSLNYYPGDNMCELNSEDSMTSPLSMVPHDGFVQYFDISDWPTVIFLLYRFPSSVNFQQMTLSNCCLIFSESKVWDFKI